MYGRALGSPIKCHKMPSVAHGLLLSGTQCLCLRIPLACLLSTKQQVSESPSCAMSIRKCCLKSVRKLNTGLKNDRYICEVLLVTPVVLRTIFL